MSNYSPLISIVTICYNSSATIEETIKSVLSQDYERIEYIIVDGASTDSTMSIVGKYSDKISKIISEPDKGISDAFNKGVRTASGDLICMINSDDILLPGSLKKVAKFYDSSIDIYRANVIITNLKTGYRGRAIPDMKFPIIIKPWICTNHQGTFISSNAYNKFGLYKENILYTMDLDLLMRYYRKGAIFKYINVDIAEFRIGGVSNSDIEKKRGDIYSCSLNNGGNYIISRFNYFSFWMFDKMKKITVLLFNDEFLKSFHYKKYSKK